MSDWDDDELLHDEQDGGYDEGYDEDAEGAEPIAILGMAGRFPEAGDLDTFWRNVRDGVECISFFSDDQLEVKPEPEMLASPKFVKARGVLGEIDLFDAAFFDISPREAELMDPQHRLFLEVCWEALERAGYPPERVEGPVGVYGGATSSTYLVYNIYSNPHIIAAAGGYQIGLSTDKDFITTRVSYKLDLRGPSVNVQTACSTSAVAIVQACQALLTYQCDMALAGGASVRVPQHSGYVYQEGGLDSSDGHCRAFDAKADGSVYGSGVGVVLLKRLSEALEDGDPIQAVILGAAINNDGSSKVGFTAPSIEGQAEVIATAQALAAIDPDTIQYIETHGTGTALGDPIEVSALTRAFGEHTERKQYCALGSVKPNIGHLSAAAGAAGVIKTVLALKNRQIPPSINYDTPNPQIPFEETPFFVNSELRPWERENGTPRRAASSSFGLGGTNAHILYEEAPEREASGPSRDAQLLVLSARSSAALDAATANLAAHLAAEVDKEESELRLADVAYTLQLGRRAFEHRRITVVRAKGEAGDVDAARKALTDSGPHLLSGAAKVERPLVFLFSGLGDHYIHLGHGLYEREEVFRQELDHAAELLEPHLEADIREVLFPGPAPTFEGAGGGKLDLKALLGRSKEPEDPAAAEARERLERTDVAQPALFAVEHALARLLMSWGLIPEAVIGYSLGEYVAATVAGVLSLEDACALVARRAKLVDALPVGSMLAVPLERAEVEARLPERLDLAAVNGPHLSVVAGPSDAIDAFEAELAEDDVPCRRLGTTHAFHSRMMSPAADSVTDLARRLSPNPPEIPLLSNVTGTWMRPEEATDPSYWARHLVSPVRFSDGLAELWRNPVRALVEIGPGNGLTTLALQHPGPDDAKSSDAPRLAIPAMRHQHERQDDQAFLLTAIGKLWLAGIEPDWTALYEGETRYRVELPTYPFERKRFWLDPGPGFIAAPAKASDSTAHEAGETAEAAVSTVVRAEHERPELATAYAAPSTKLEEELAAMWEELLGVKEPGIDDSFFELGGHSLQGTRLLSRLRDAYDVSLPLHLLFEGPTVRQLAEALDTLRGTEDVSNLGPALEAIPRDPQGMPVSFTQNRLWFLDRLEGNTTFYNLPAVYHFKGNFDVARLERAFQGLVERHESLRTALHDTGDGEPVQRIVDDLHFELPVVELDVEMAAASPQERLAKARHRALELGQAPFDLTVAPLFRAKVLRVAADHHVLSLTLHHTVADGWSLGVMVRELGALYHLDPAQDGKTHADVLPAMPIQFADYAVWQRELLSGETLDTLAGFWRQRLAGAPTTELPIDRPRPPVQTYRGDSLRGTLPRETGEALEGVARARDTSFFMALFTVWSTLVLRHTGQKDLVFGTPVAGRPRQELEGLIGFFANSLVLRVDLSGDPTFSEALARTREASLAAFEHQDLPFEQLVEVLKPRRDLSRNPIFSLMFNLLNTPAGDGEDDANLGDGLTLSTEPGETGGALFDLTIYVYEPRHGFQINWEHNTDLFDRSTIARFHGGLERLLAEAAARPEARLSELALLTPAARHQLVVEHNDTTVEPGASTSASSGAPGVDARVLTRRLWAAAAEHAERPAVAGSDGTVWTYHDLFRRATMLADLLDGYGLQAEDRVAISLQRSPDLLVAVLGTLGAGATYVPVDPAYPKDRRAYVMDDAGITMVLTESELLGDLPPTEAEVIAIDQMELDVPPAQDTDGLELPVRHLSPEHAAYVLYTSGSTGRPKGVVVSHDAIVNFLDAMAERPGMETDDVLLAVTSLSFDIAGLELFLPLLCGARIEMANEAETLDGAALLARLDAGVSAMQATPATWRLLLAAGWDAYRDLKVLCGGEAFPGDLAAALVAQSREVWNVYGPTETTVWSTTERITRAHRSTAAVSLGRPIHNTSIHLLDRGGRPVPLGSAGALWIGGHGLARGYHGQPAKTAAVFAPDPLAETPGARLYFTGDLARQKADGRLEYLGRLDHQVKVRGYRIELGEIEAALLTQDAVAEAVAVARGSGGDTRLVAFVTTPDDCPEPAMAELRDGVREHLPDYMVPAAVVRLDSLPLTPNNKVDRKALAELTLDAETWGDASAVPTAPRNPTEEMLADVFGELLGIERPGVHDDFFARGGHSLLAAQAVARVRQRFGVEVPLQTFFQAPTVAGLAAAVEGARLAGEARRLPALEQADRKAPLPLSWAQERLWFLDQLDPGQAFYNLHIHHIFQGPFDLAILASATAALGARHEALRTVFRADTDGNPVQLIAEPHEVDLAPRVVDLTGLVEDVRLKAFADLARAEARRPFDLATGPLARFFVGRLDAERHGVLAIIHHTIADAWSLGVLLHDLGQLYDAAALKRSAQLPALPAQPADVAHWQREWLGEGALERQIDYWRGRLEGAPSVLELPTDYPRPSSQSFRGGSVRFRLPERSAQAAATLARSQGTTLFMVLLAAYQTLLARYSGQSDVVVGTPVANRTPPETEGMVGLFLNTLALRSALPDADSPARLLSRTRELVLADYAHQDVPFGRLVEELQPERDLSHTPVFQVMLVLQNTPATRMDLSGGVSAESVTLDTGTVQFDLTLGLSELEGGGLSGVVDFSRDLWEETTMRRLVGHLGTLLGSMAADPERRIDELALLTDAEHHQVMREWSGRAAPYAEGKGLHELFEEQADRTPDTVALWCEETARGAALESLWTYAELEARANRLAHTLVERGVGPEVRVAVCAERSNEAVMGLLAVMKSGGAYVPLDPAYPADRLTFMLSDSGAGIVLSQPWLRELFPDLESLAPDLEELPLDTRWSGPADDPKAARLAPQVGADGLVYQIYTSGSTGKPKGVLVPHAGLVNVCEDLVDVWDLEIGSRHITFNSLAFDAAASNVYPPLLCGATYVQHPDPASLAPRDLERFCDERRITHLDIPPSYWVPWLDELEAREQSSGPLLIDCVQLNLGGDSAALTNVRRWARLTEGRVKIFGPYGPTETTVGSTFNLSVHGREVSPPAVRLPIGRPFINTWIHLLDRRMRPVAAGLEGEVYIAGIGVTRGYLHRSGETAEKFVPDPFGGARTGDGIADGDLADGARFYRTGDLARWLPDGSLEFLGRVDHQVKIRGFRVELGEIEAALGDHPAVQRAVVLAREKSHGDKRLVAYMTPAGGNGSSGDGSVGSNSPSNGSEPATLAELRAFLADQLPTYMAPSATVWMPRFPLSPTGKVDRKALPEPEWGAAAGGTAASEPPRTELEKTLAPIWAEVLGGGDSTEDAHDVVAAGPGRHDDFFDLGGHSLLATQVISRVRETWGVELPLRVLFEAPTLSGMAEKISDALGVDRHDEPPLVAVPRQGDPEGDALPLSFAQQRLWFLDQLNPGSSAYNLPDAFRLRGAFDPAIFRAALSALVARHETLRTRFDWRGTEPMQIVEPVRPVALPRIDLRGLAEDARLAELERLAVNEAARPFDLQTGPLLRARVVLLGDNDHGLLLNQHHIVSDGWSIGLFMSEVTTFYAAVQAGRPSPLPALPLQYADYSAWQREKLSGEGLERELAFWHGQLDGAPPALDLPTDRPRPELQGVAGAARRRELSPELSVAIQRLSQAEGATVFMTLLAAYKGLLARWAAQDDVVVGVGVANRNRFETEGLIGFFVNTLPMRTRLNGNPSFRDLLARVRHTSLDCFAHEDMPFDKLVEELEVERDLSRMPLTQVAFVLQNAPTPPPAITEDGAEEGQDLIFEPLRREVTSAKWDLLLGAVEGAEQIALTAEYSTDLFDAATIDRFLERYEELLAAICDDAAQTLWMLPVLRDDVAAALTQALGETASASEIAESEAIAPLTPTQRDLYLDHLIDPEGTIYSLGLSVELGTDVDTQRWQEAVELAHDAEQTTRTRFVALRGEPYQAVEPAGQGNLFSFEEIVLGDKSHGLETLEDVIAARVKVPYDLSRGPLVRHFLVRGTDGTHTALLAVCHIVCDAYSGRLFFERAATVYAALEREETPETSAPSFLDAVPGSLQRFDTPEVEDFWRHRLAGAVPLELPPAPGDPTDATGAWLTESVRIDGERLATLRAYCERHSLSAAALLRAVYALAVQGLSQPDGDLVLYDVVGGRTKGEGDLLGCFYQVVPVVLEPGHFAPDQDLTSFLDHVRGYRRSLGEHQNLSVLLQRRLAPQGGLRFFYNYYNFAVVDLLGNEATLKVHDSFPDDEIHWIVSDNGDHLQATLHHHAGASIDLALVERLENLLDAILGGATRLAELGLLLSDEREQLAAWNATDVEWTPKSAAWPGKIAPESDTLASLVRRQAARTPDAPALIFEGEELTYTEFDQRVDTVARALAARGVGRENAVGVFLERSFDMVVALHAIVRAGGAYLPINPLDPPERAAFMLEDAKVAIVLTEEAHRSRLEDGLSGQTSELHLVSELADAGQSAPQLTSEPVPDQMAYVIYTSGSTGKPKGAMNAHRGIVNRLLWMQSAYPLDATDRVLQKTPYTFDVSVWEFFWPLMVGAPLVVAKPEGHKDPGYLAELVQKSGVTTLHFVPSMLEIFLADPASAACDASQGGPLRRVIASGEALAPTLVERFFTNLPESQLHNLYGPTEAAVDVSYWATSSADADIGQVPIGQPIANLRLHVHDRHLGLRPAGLPGELALAGTGVGRGYFQRPGLTAERFVPDPWSPTPGGRLYRTGDLVRQGDRDGNLLFLGRVDHQVKLRGFRIELGEIESVLRRHPEIGEAVVMAREDVPGDVRLAAYLTLTGAGAAPEDDELREHLTVDLPEYMVPSDFVTLDALPLNPSGKVDRKVLPAPQRRAAGADFTPPSTPTEQMLADLWGRVLRVERVGLMDNFFDLGGHSLLLAQVLAEIKTRLEIELSMVELFQHPTVAGLAGHLDGKIRGIAVNAEKAEERKSQANERAAQRKRAASARRRPRPPRRK